MKQLRLPSHFLARSLWRHRISFVRPTCCSGSVLAKALYYWAQGRGFNHSHSGRSSDRGESKSVRVSRLQRTLKNLRWPKPIRSPTLRRTSYPRCNFCTLNPTTNRSCLYDWRPPTKATAKNMTAQWLCIVGFYTPTLHRPWGAP